MTDLQTALPWLGASPCEWTPQGATSPCGAPSTWHLTTHDFTPGCTDPEATRLWLMCADCALNVLGWAKQAHADGDGFNCKSCHHMFVPALGAFIKSHGELGDPRQDVVYG